MKTWIISLLVNNHFGVLTRVTGLFSRRGYNIISLSVGETEDSAFSRITIQTGTDAAGIHQVMKQLQKLEDVKKVQLLPGEETVVKELMLVKLHIPEGRREKLTEEIAKHSEGLQFSCKEAYTGADKCPPVDISSRASLVEAYTDNRMIIFEFTGETAQCDALLEIFSKHKILEISRTGITALSVTSEI